MSDIIYRWKTNEPINPDNIIEVAEWCNHFSGINRQPTDVSRALERCVIAAYQCGYLQNAHYEYCISLDPEIRKGKKTFLEDTLASILIHTWASWEMTGRCCIKMFNEREMINFASTFSEMEKKYKTLCSSPSQFKDVFNQLANNMFKYQRWMLYLHMNRTKRWNEPEFKACFMFIFHIIMHMGAMSECSVREGIKQSILKLQDGEIKRH